MKFLPAHIVILAAFWVLGESAQIRNMHLEKREINVTAVTGGDGGREKRSPAAGMPGCSGSYCYRYCLGSSGPWCYSAEGCADASSCDDAWECSLPCGFMDPGCVEFCLPPPDIDYMSDGPDVPFSDGPPPGMGGPPPGMDGPPPGMDGPPPGMDGPPPGMGGPPPGMDGPPPDMDGPPPGMDGPPPGMDGPPPGMGGPPPGMDGPPPGMDGSPPGMDGSPPGMDGPPGPGMDGMYF